MNIAPLWDVHSFHAKIVFGQYVFWYSVMLLYEQLIGLDALEESNAVPGYFARFEE